MKLHKVSLADLWSNRKRYVVGCAGSARSAVDLAHVTRALAALGSSGETRGRHRQGHAAVAAWVDGVEWAAFVDGRIQGWIPEVENVRTATGDLARQVEKMIWAWEAGLVGGAP